MTVSLLHPTMATGIFVPLTRNDRKRATPDRSRSSQPAGQRAPRREPLSVSRLLTGTARNHNTTKALKSIT